MLNIREKTWHAKLFRFTINLISKFAGKEYLKWKFEGSTNICHYIRTLVVYLPLLLLAHIVPVIYLIYVVFFYSIQTFGIVNIIATLAVIVLSSLAVCIAMLGLFKLFEMTEIFEYKISRPDSFWNVSKEFIVANKTKFCSKISFIKEENL